jgi:hypothetical protein
MITDFNKICVADLISRGIRISKARDANNSRKVEYS